MKTKLTSLIAIGLSLVSGFSQSFNGSIMDLDTGRIKFYAGTINIQQNEIDASLCRTGEIIDSMREQTRRSMERIKAESARSSAEFAAFETKQQLEEQIRLLRKIAEQK